VESFISLCEARGDAILRQIGLFVPDGAPRHLRWVPVVLLRRYENRLHREAHSLRGSIRTAGHYLESSCDYRY
jgi:hypothetical protein